MMKKALHIRGEENFEKEVQPYLDLGWSIKTMTSAAFASVAVIFVYLEKEC